MSGEIVILGRHDEPELLAYFDAYIDPTIELRIVWHDDVSRFAAWRRHGRIAGIAAHNQRNGAVQVHAAEEDALAELARACMFSGTPISAVAGPPEQVPVAIAALGLEGRAVARTSREIIMALDLDELVLPELLSQPGIVVRRATEDDLPLLNEWRVRYFQEVHRIAAPEEAIAEVRLGQSRGRLWVLEDAGRVVNTAAFSAVFPTLVQVEYAYSPAELRSKQYGRSAVAGALAAVRGDGIRRAVFNTDENNKAVQVGIHPIGFRTTHRYVAIIFAA